MIDCLINLRCSLLDDERVKERPTTTPAEAAVMYFVKCAISSKNANGGFSPNE